MRNKLLLTILSVFILMLLSCGNPSTTEVDPDTVTDIDGNVYNTIRIGNQLWTVENLRTTKYNDGLVIPHITDSAGWVNDTLGAYSYYNNTTNADSIKKFGSLYNWYAVVSKKLASNGWHVSTDAEWTELQNYLIANGFNWDGTTDTTVYNKIAKSLAAESDWRADSIPGTIGNDLTKNNRSGFSALPSGYRLNEGYFYLIGSYGTWWSATEGDASLLWSRNLYYGGGSLSRGSSNKSCGFSVRLVKD